MDTFAIQGSVVNGLLMSLVITVLIFVSLYINPRLWLNDYPKAIQAVVPPLTPAEKRMQWVVFFPFLAVLVGGLWLSMAQLKAASGGTLTFGTAYLHAFAITQTFNLFDAVVIDYLILTLMKPKFAFIPGTEALMLQHATVRWQVNNFFKGVVICSVASLIVALIASL